jgi:hypothetical protein
MENRPFLKKKHVVLFLGTVIRSAILLYLRDRWEFSVEVQILAPGEGSREPAGSAATGERLIVMS